MLRSPPMIIDAAIRTFIESQRTARLATVDEHARPHIVPICFALEGDTLYTPIDEKPKRGDYTRLRRLRNIADSPNVQALFDLYDDADWSRLQYVQIRGAARILTTGDEHTRAIRLLRARYDQYATMALESRPIVAIDAAQIVGWTASAG